MYEPNVFKPVDKNHPSVKKANLKNNLNDAEAVESEIIRDPSASNWLKSQVINLKRRDVVDAINDVEKLLEVLKGRVNAVR